MKLNLASSNPHKLEEFLELFKDNIFSLDKAPASLDVKEGEVSFQENAGLKARAYFEKFNTAALADDSGLVLPHFPEILGVTSARFHPELENYEDKCHKLIEYLADASQEKRKAYFLCYLCFYFSPDEVFYFEGRVHGRISHELLGDQGFGYDQIFIPEGQKLSFAQDPQWKQVNSHRSKAAKAASNFFQGYRSGK